ncbi:NAD-dependent alcohol dehydrogenase [Fulvia fulva]|uniref:NAD-dependent alcohol dehydrogenase n=1 Tax=Passalora fulva TaxID=5499 RepID=A0A9Q8L728_PASFU|nr:NAD-dependent alcohol dehydrogenase [Fulvia fulva]KAK4634757.1 NAD-dependent alcohol dehydrogenase [Fulvia fulva]KAK4638307.1 NAD-dependent alcohol dehydrogenase [Fulvia fulva]UJO12052.1 NAD-dependent alcohol dehydrogenase [Fulvia fulva]WPV10374.1 NAD-dependent alcohol dehydrogenase [Fulvia fulva]WPV24179.1 NAD-dependent alcohol dehydrogenase [Fulvia fulva]
MEVGDPVILHPLATCGLCRACRFGDDVHCENSTFPGINVDGGYAEYMKTTARSIVKLDPKLKPADVVALADAGLTAHHVASKAAKFLRPGDNCLAKQIGADHTVQATDDGSFVKEVLELTNGQGAEAVIDFVAEGGSTSTGVKMLRRAGNHYVVGYGENINIPTIDIISAEINFIGNLVGSYNDLVELMTLAAQGKVKLHTTQYKLEDFQKAIDDLSSGKVRGRAILIP